MRKGFINKGENGWSILYASDNTIDGKKYMTTIPLHPDDVRDLKLDESDNPDVILKEVIFNIVSVYIEPHESIHSNRGVDRDYGKLVLSTNDYIDNLIEEEGYRQCRSIVDEYGNQTEDSMRGFILGAKWAINELKNNLHDNKS